MLTSSYMLLAWVQQQAVPTPCLWCQSRSFGLPVSDSSDHLNRSVPIAMELNWLVLTTTLDKLDSTIPARSITTNYNDVVYSDLSIHVLRQLSVFNTLNSKNKKYHLKKLESNLTNQVLFMIFYLGFYVILFINYVSTIIMLD